MNNFPKDNINFEGNTRLHKDTQTLRIGNGEKEVAQFFQPMSAYKPISESNIKKGTPVSIALVDELVGSDINTKDPYVVQTDSNKHKWIIGLALEPADGQKPIHIINHGKLIFDKKDLKDDKRKDKIQFPPYNTTGFLWTYADVGKTVYVDNRTGHEGQLTLNIEDAYANGGNIITIGHLADQPSTDTQDTGTQLVIEVQPSGDSRSIQDSTEFVVHLQSKKANDPEYLNTTDNDKLIQVKLEYNEGQVRGIPILNDAILWENTENSPVALFVANPNTNYWDTNILVSRFGIIKGNFDFEGEDFGKTLYLSKGNIGSKNEAFLYEYKVGLVLGEEDSKQKVLIDCRYPKQFNVFDPIGKIKPCITKTNNKPLPDPGYLAMDGNFYNIADYQDLFNIARKQGLVNKVKGNEEVLYQEIQNWENSQSNYEYFSLKEMNYTLEGNKILSQIKYSKEGSPNNMQYVWPMQQYNLSITAKSGVQANEDLSNTNIDSILNITSLVHTDANATEELSIEDFEVQMMVQNGEDKGLILSPGFHQVRMKFDEGSVSDENIVEEDYFVGYEWKYVNKEDNHYLVLITKLSDIDPDKCRGIFYPGVSHKVTNLKEVYKIQNSDKSLEVICTVRRRPSFYHSLMLNQLYSDSTWNADIYSDGKNIGVEGKLYFGLGTKDPGERPYSNSLSMDIFNNIPTEVHEYRQTDKQSEKAVVIHKPYQNNSSEFKAIKTTYDFKNNSVKYHSDVEGYWMQPSTAEDNIGSTSYDITKFTFMELAHAIAKGNKFFRYTDGGREVYQPTKEKLALEKDSYTILGKDIAITDEKWSQITTVIDLAYPRDYAVQSFQTNIGILLSATKETQERLQSLEFMLFGETQDNGLTTIFENNPRGIQDASNNIKEIVYNETGENLPEKSYLVKSAKKINEHLNNKPGEKHSLDELPRMKAQLEMAKQNLSIDLEKPYDAHLIKMGSSIDNIEIKENTLELGISQYMEYASKTTLTSREWFPKDASGDDQLFVRQKVSNDIQVENAIELEFGFKSSGDTKIQTAVGGHLQYPIDKTKGFVAKKKEGDLIYFDSDVTSNGVKLKNKKYINDTPVAIEDTSYQLYYIPDISMKQICYTPKSDNGVNRFCRFTAPEGSDTAGWYLFQKELTGTNIDLNAIQVDGLSSQTFENNSATLTLKAMTEYAIILTNNNKKYVNLFIFDYDDSTPEYKLLLKDPLTKAKLDLKDEAKPTGSYSIYFGSYLLLDREYTSKNITWTCYPIITSSSLLAKYNILTKDEDNLFYGKTTGLYTNELFVSIDSQLSNTETLKIENVNKTNIQISYTDKEGDPRTIEVNENQKNVIMPPGAITIELTDNFSYYPRVYKFFQTKNEIDNNIYKNLITIGKLQSSNDPKPELPIDPSNFELSTKKYTLSAIKSDWFISNSNESEGINIHTTKISETKRLSLPIAASIINNN